MAARLLDETIHLAQAETGAVSGVLRREERVERPGERIGTHADARVGDRQRYVLAGHDFDLAGGVALVERGVGCLDGQLSAVGHRVARIDGEIEDGVLQLVRVDARAPEPAGQNDLDGDLLADRSSQEIRHFGDQPVDVDGLGFERLLSRKGEQALRQEAARWAPRMAFSASRSRLPPSESRRLQLALKGFQIADDDRQQVVEVVRDAAGQVADALHLLRLPQRLFGLTTRREFDRLGSDAHQRARRDRAPGASGSRTIASRRRGD